MTSFEYMANATGQLRKACQGQNGIGLFDSGEGSIASEGFGGEYVQHILDDLSADCTFIFHGKNRRRIEFSKTAATLFGLPSRIVAPDIEKIASYVVIDSEDRATFLKALDSCLLRKDNFLAADVPVQVRGQSPVLISVRLHFVYEEDGTLEIAFGSLLNVQKLLDYMRSLRQQSMVNHITLLPNRQKFYLDMKELLEKTDAKGYLLLIDINSFKEINGTYNHGIGDKVLRETASHLSRLTDEFGSVYNYNVDQFIVNARDASRLSAWELMETIYEYFKDQIRITDVLNLQIECTLAAVSYRGGSTTVDDLLVNLDIAIQSVKLEQRHYDFFTAKDRGSFLERINLNAALHKAVEHNFDGFMLYYQPLISSSDKRCIGAEALLRWRNAEGEIISPLEIIPVLEKSGLMALVEEWIINTACRQCSQWIKEGFSPDFFVHVNLSPVQISRPTLFSEIQNALSKNGLELHNLLFEVTESSGMLDRKSAVNALICLRDLGLKVAIDDFGTGYSSLSYLSSLPADEVKIDRSFLADIVKDPSALSFLTSIVGLAKSMNFQVCVEGVETQEESALISKLDIDTLQGFFFGQPVPPELFLSSLPASQD